MKKLTPLFAAVALSGACATAVLFSPAAVAASSDYTSPETQDKEKADWLPIPEVIKRLQAKGYTNPRIERVKHGYEAYVNKPNDPDGYRVQLLLDPHTGEPIERKPRNAD
ncbi:MAG: PepSY domain-containing protein [Azonexus sp.]|nr:PepSY domain-containing protein [Azonexus sp.]